MNRISINQAAAQFGVSRRTLQRWVRNGRLITVPHVDDGRQRLVDPEMVRRLVGQMTKRRAKQNPPGLGDEPLFTANAALRNDRERIESSDFSAIDTALLLAYRMHRRLLCRLDAEPVQELKLEDLREGPLGRDLQRLAAYARGQVYEDSRLVRSAIDSVLQVLFWPAATLDYSIPRSFWDTELGRLLSRAKLRAYTPNELIGVEEAARRLGLTATTLYRWMDDRTFDWVRDDANGRTWVVRRDVERIERKTTELSTRQAVPERALAS